MTLWSMRAARLIDWTKREKWHISHFLLMISVKSVVAESSFIPSSWSYVLDVFTLLRDLRNAELLLLNSWMVFSRALFSSSIFRILASRPSPFCLSSSLSCAAWWEAHIRDSECSASTDSVCNAVVCSKTSYLCDVVRLWFLLFPLRSCHRKHHDLKACLHRVDLRQFLIQFGTDTKSIGK